MTPVMPIAALSEGDTHLVQVAGRKILVCLVEGQFYAVEGICPHAGQSLAAGRLRGYEVSCPLHGARFDVRTGACTAAPAQSPIERFPVVLEGGKVCIEINNH